MTNPTSDLATGTSVTWRVRWRLSVLWLLEWGITGALLTYLPLYFTQNGLSLDETGPLLAIGAVGLWVAPFVVGQVCDRWMASERYLALAHFIGGVTLLAIPLATEVYRETGEGFRAILILFGLYAAAYLPTMPLASALTFRHLPRPRVQFGGIRLFGTVGWVLAGLGLSLWLGRTYARKWLLASLPSTGPLISQLDDIFSWLPPPSSRDCFLIAALLSFALSSFCVFLPATPPPRTPREQIAPLAVLKMFRHRTFTRLILVSCLLALVMPLYSLAAPALLEQTGVSADWVPAVMTIGQISEFPALLLLPWFLRKTGLRVTFMIGILAWLLRYLLFAVSRSGFWILAGISLHGVCHVFLIIVLQLFTDAHCPRDLRASAQNLFAFMTLGVAMPLGLLLSQPLIQSCTDASTDTVDYQTLFAVPTAILAGILVLYWWWSRTDTPAQVTGKDVHPTATVG